MYSRADRIRAVELWLKYDKSESSVINELGYPSHKMLAKWHRDLLQEEETGVRQDERLRSGAYTAMQKLTAVNHYFEHGRCMARTIRALGYPCQELLARWCDELAPNKRKRSLNAVQFSQEQKQDAVIALCSRHESAKEVAEAIGTNRVSLYNWKRQLLGEGARMPKRSELDDDLPNDKEQLLSEIGTLKKQIRQLKMEKDILEAAAELIKKDPGVDPKNLSNREKTILIDALRNEYPLKALLEKLFISRSSYHYQHVAQSLESKYKPLSDHIINLFETNYRCYGYRRIHGLLSQEGTKISEKVVRTLMAEAGLIVRQRRRRKYNSYAGEISPAPANLIERDFHADTPNKKWLTDITEFHIPAGKAYLSPIVDCFDGKLISWTISTRPDAEMVNTMLDIATDTLSEGMGPIIHTDRGCHYRWPGWQIRVANSNLIQSMSKKGCSPDNSACEGLFGRIKNEMFYNRSWKGTSMDSFMEVLDDYLHWYNNKRIKVSLGNMSPVQYRYSLDLAQ